MRLIYVIILTCAIILTVKSEEEIEELHELPELPETCDSPIYCKGNLLHVVQFARLYDDCKTFVDLKIKYDIKTTIMDFEEFMRDSDDNPTTEQLKYFVDQHFEQDNELEEATLEDFNPAPPFIETIIDEDVKEFALNLIGIWPTLARKVKSDVEEAQDLYSIIPVPNAFIIPGGRFREIYYWDSYWIIDGLLVCEMYETAKGMLDNFVAIVKRYGIIPNGTRVYYLQRSQPPLFVPMVYNYYVHTEDIGWVYSNIQYLEDELNYWLGKKTVKIIENGEEYVLAHFCADSLGPRPESYREDIHTAAIFNDSKKRQEVYNDLKAGAESGWDFSSRWIFDQNGGTNANLSYIETRRVLPVDLNSFLFMSFDCIAKLYFIINNPKRSIYWNEKAVKWKKAIDKLLYNEEDGIWYDYDIKLRQHRKGFYPTNFAPLWSKAFDAIEGLNLGKSAAKYLLDNHIHDYVGGIPSSFLPSGEQWDFPNAWAPAQSIVIEGLENSGNLAASKEARKLAERWVQCNMKGYNKHEAMFEKYDAQTFGAFGGGGEYEVQSGFGWTNGVVLRFIKTYYTSQTLPTPSPT